MAFNELKEYQKARNYFETALSYKNIKKETLIRYGKLLLKLNEHARGLKMVAKGQGLVRFNQNNFEIVDHEKN